ncbi:MAG: hypothetical protein IPO64_08125 [Bacteroidetes bacterium]|nr:hypothetical protein [Bacteroidota bacterium]
MFQISGVRYFDGSPTFWGNKLNGNDADWSILNFKLSLMNYLKMEKKQQLNFYFYKKQAITVEETNGINFLFGQYNKEALSM